MHIIKFVAIGCDGTTVNTGLKGGVIRNMVLILRRSLQWFVLPFHIYENPLRHIFEHVEGTTTGSGRFTDEIGIFFLDMKANCIFIHIKRKHFM